MGNCAANSPYSFPENTFIKQPTPKPALRLGALAWEVHDLTSHCWLDTCSWGGEGHHRASQRGFFYIRLPSFKKQRNKGSSDTSSQNEASMTEMTENY